MPTVLSPKEFSLVIVTAVYIPPQADTTTALRELHWTLCNLETIYPEAAFIVAVDFNKANLRTRLPKFYQHIDCSCYSNFCNVYKAFHCSPFSTSDHDSILLLPSYRQKLKQDVPELRTIQCWLTNRNPLFKTVLITRTGTYSG